ncbi:MAG: amidohydrolase family protein [Planctomycetes bacterium]|nr:amidohydrolase family protein [Planctomycetota bacterium]
MEQTKNGGQMTEDGGWNAEDRGQSTDLPGRPSSVVRPLVLPGLVDLQINGYKDVDFSGDSLTEDSCARACRQLLDAGTTAFLPTVITSPDEIYERNLPILAWALHQEEFQGRVLGLHLEGPFISTEDGARGAHNAAWVRRPDVAYLQKLIDLSGGTVRLITIAADQDGAEELARYASSRGVAVALGHHMANEQDLQRLVKSGAKALTHLGNGVPALLSRHQNPVWAGLANDDLAATIIADGHHLPPALLKIFIRAKGVGRGIVISDATSLAGLPPGEYWSMGARVRLQEDGKLFNPATGYMAGSSATILACANHLVGLGIAGLNELSQMLFYNPLRLIGISPRQVRIDKRVFFDARERRVFQEEPPEAEIPSTKSQIPNKAKIQNSNDRNAHAGLGRF